MGVQQEFKKILGQGLRPSDYEISISDILGISSLLGQKLPIDKIQRYMLLCKSASLPGDNVNLVEVPYKGIIHKLPGSRTFESFPLGFYNDPDLIIQTFFRTWLAANSGFNSSGEVILNGFTTNLKLIMYNTKQEPIGGVILYQAWPNIVSTVDLTSDDKDSLQEVSVELAYTMHKFVPLSGIKEIMKGINSVFDSISKNTLI